MVIWINVTLETPLKELKKVPNISRMLLFLLKEYGVTNVRELLAVDPISFLEMKGVGKSTYLKLKQLQERLEPLLEE